MKKLIPFYGWLVVAIASSCFGQEAPKEASVKATKPQKGTALVELFTSEGCSSCPPADKLLSKIKTGNDAIVLSYHVDYWNSLGWKDSFSQAAFSERQRQYAQKFSLESVYTPQMIVNGQEEFVGSDEGRLRASLAKNNLTTDAIKAIATRNKNETVQLSYSLSNISSSLLNIALVQPEATTAVKRGENEGRTLHHVNVVSELKTIGPQTSGTVEIKIPSALEATPLSLVVFTQEMSSGKINGVVQIDVPSYQK